MNNPSIDSLCEEYMEKHAKPNKRTWKNDLSMLRHHVIPVLGDYLVADVRRTDISRRLTKRLARESLHRRIGYAP